MTRKLRDGRSQTGPGPFFRALSTAARLSARSKRPGRTAPSPSAIAGGVEAAHILHAATCGARHPWVETAFGILEGIETPCPEAEVTAVWEKYKVLDRLVENATTGRPGSALRRVHAGPADLRRVGVRTKSEPGTFDVSDAYFVRYRMRRRARRGRAR